MVASARGGAIPTSPPPDDAFARLGLDNRGFDGVPITPGTRFIFIHRHPEVVVQSNAPRRSHVLHAKHPYLALLSVEYDRLFSRPLLLTFFRMLATARFGIGARLAVRVVANANRYYVRNIGRLRPTRS